MGTDIEKAAADELPKAWPLGAYAPGNYFCKCVHCRAELVGDKRALECLECAVGNAKWLSAKGAGELRVWQDWYAATSKSLDDLIHAASVFWGTGSEQHNLIRDVADAVRKTAPCQPNSNATGVI